MEDKEKGMDSVRECVANVNTDISAIVYELKLLA